MSASSSIKSRLSYLDRGARKIYHEAPSVASAMEAEYNQLILDGGRIKQKDMQTRRREVCLACGNLSGLEQHDPGASELENGSTTPLSNSAKRRLRAKRLRQASRTDANKGSQSTSQRSTVLDEETLTCSRCLCKTHLKHPTTPTVFRPSRLSEVVDGNAQNGIQTSLSGLQTEQATPAPPGPGRQLASANRSSKQRAKARKQGGLQAILTKTKASQNTGPDLDLMDFMQE